MERLNIGQSDGLGHLVDYIDLLPSAVDEAELAFGEEDGQGNAGEAAASAEVENAGAWTEMNELGDSERVQHMMLVEIVNVLARNHVDFAVPVAVKSVEGVNLFLLHGREVGEIL